MYFFIQIAAAVFLFHTEGSWRQHAVSKSENTVIVTGGMLPCIGAATLGVVGVWTPQKFKLGVSDTPKKLKGNITR